MEFPSVSSFRNASEGYVTYRTCRDESIDHPTPTDNEAPMDSNTRHKSNNLQRKQLIPRSQTQQR